MKGRNQLHLNTATMMEIVQQWLDGEMPHAPTVTGFARESANGPGFSYVVDLDSEADRPGPAQP